MGVCVSGGEEICGGNREWGGSELVGDVPGDLLEHFWGLGFPKEAGGVVVEGALPLDDHIWVHCWVEWELVKPCCHVSFGEEDILGEEGDKGAEGFISDVGVLGGHVDVSGVHQEHVFVWAFLFDLQG